MDILRGFTSVLGAQNEANESSGAETVEKLCDRVSSSTLLEDRRDAVRALKSLSKKYKLEVGTRAMDLLTNVLTNDRNDSEILGLALEALCNVTNAEPPTQQEENSMKESQIASDAELGVQFTEIFIKNQENVSVLLSLLEEYDFHVRWPAVRLLTILLKNRCYQLQQCVLVNPMGVSRLMDLLSDSREIIRNEGLLLLAQLTKSNAAIQKIVAFENAFDRLIEIIAEEEYSDGGIVVEDCLLLMLSLLKSNVSNQNFFREGSYIQRMTPFFEIEIALPADSDRKWSTQKKSNIDFMLKILRTLVSPNNPQQTTAFAQRIMNQCGILRLLCGILMATGIPSDILTETINTVSEVIRGNQENQNYFALVNAPCTPPRSAVVVLLMSMINEKQPFNLRCAVLYCFQCYLYKNDQGQTQVVTTLLPSAADVSTITAGQLLCAGLFSPNSFSNWCASIALSHCLKDNGDQKEQLLRVQLAASVGNPPISLLDQCTNMLSQGGTMQAKIGLLSLLCRWLTSCPIAVSHFLRNTSNIPFLTAQIQNHGSEEEERIVSGLSALLLGICANDNDGTVQEYTRESIRHLISKRIGTDNFLDRIHHIYKTEYYSQAAKAPEIQAATAEQVFFDHEFTKLFKKLEATVSGALEGGPENEIRANVASPVYQSENQASVISSYKNLIKDQDVELSALKGKYTEMETSHTQAQIQLQKQALEIQKLKDQLNNPYKDDTSACPEGEEKLFEELDSLRHALSTASHNFENSKQEIKDKEDRIKQLERELEISQASLAVANAASILNDSEEQGNIPNISQQEITELQQSRLALSSLQEEVEALRSQNITLRTELATQGDPNSSSNAEVIVQLEAKLAEFLKELDNVREEKNNILKEQEDLLVLLSDQDAKCTKYKKRLRDLGELVVDGNEDDDVSDDVSDDASDDVDSEEDQNENDQNENDQNIIDQTGEVSEEASVTSKVNEVIVADGNEVIEEGIVAESSNEKSTKADTSMNGDEDTAENELATNLDQPDPVKTTAPEVTDSLLAQDEEENDI